MNNAKMNSITDKNLSEIRCILLTILHHLTAYSRRLVHITNVNLLLNVRG